MWEEMGFSGLLNESHFAYWEMQFVNANKLQVAMLIM